MGFPVQSDYAVIQIAMASEVGGSTEEHNYEVH